MPSHPTRPISAAHLCLPSRCQTRPPHRASGLRKHNLPSGELSAQGRVSVPPTAHTGQGPGTPGVTFSQVGCMMTSPRAHEGPGKPGEPRAVKTCQDHAANPGTGRRPQARPRVARGRGSGLHQCFSASTGQEHSLPPPAVTPVTTVLWGPYTVAPSRPMGPYGSAHLAVLHAVQALTWNPTPRTSS